MPISQVQPLIMDLRVLGRNAALTQGLRCPAMVHRWCIVCESGFQPWFCDSPGQLELGSINYLKRESRGIEG
jgi:hypothetical protein